MFATTKFKALAEIYICKCQPLSKFDTLCHNLLIEISKVCLIFQNHRAIAHQLDGELSAIMP